MALEIKPTGNSAGWINNLDNKSAKTIKDDPNNADPITT